MSMRLTKAVMLGLAIVAGPMSVTPVFAAEPTAASLQPVIAAAAKAAAAKPGFASLTPEEKLAAIQLAVAEAISKTGATQDVMAAGLDQAVCPGIISAGVAISVAANVSRDSATLVSNSKCTRANLANSGSTASIGGGDNSPSVLVSLQGAPTAAGGASAYDPCAGVIAAYCGGT